MVDVYVFLCVLPVIEINQCLMCYFHEDLVFAVLTEESCSYNDLTLYSGSQNLHDNVGQMFQRFVVEKF